MRLQMRNNSGSDVKNWLKGQDWDFNLPEGTHLNADGAERVQVVRQDGKVREFWLPKSSFDKLIIETLNLDNSVCQRASWFRSLWTKLLMLIN